MLESCEDENSHSYLKQNLGFYPMYFKSNQLKENVFLVTLSVLFVSKGLKT